MLPQQIPPLSQEKSNFWHLTSGYPKTKLLKMATLLIQNGNTIDSKHVWFVLFLPSYILVQAATDLCLNLALTILAKPINYAAAHIIIHCSHQCKSYMQTIIFINFPQVLVHFVESYSQWKPNKRKQHRMMEECREQSSSIPGNSFKW